MCSITEIGENPAEIVDLKTQFFDEDTGDLVEMSEKRPVWVQPRAEGGSPMCSAFQKACEIVDEWIETHMDPYTFPPIVIHITDGESQDGDPIPHTEPLVELENDDGNVLLFHHLLSDAFADAFAFPHTHEYCPDEVSRRVFEMSSVLPEPLYKCLLADGFALQPGARGMSFNASLLPLLRNLGAGSVASNLGRPVEGN